MTLDAPDKNAARVVLPNNLEMRIEPVAIHFHLEAAPMTLWTNLYHSTLDLQSRRQSGKVGDQGFSFSTGTTRESIEVLWFWPLTPASAPY